MNEILTVHPRQYRDAQVIAESFREGVPVIINLSQMSDGDARRLIDFASGLSQGLYGKIERVTSKVFLLARARRGLGRGRRRRGRRRRLVLHARVAAVGALGRLEHPLHAAPHLLLRDVGAVRARPRAHVQPIVASARLLARGRRGRLQRD